MKVGDYVKEERGEYSRYGTLLEVYEHTDRHGRPEGVRRAMVHFDGDGCPTRGVKLGALVHVADKETR